MLECEILSVSIFFFTSVVAADFAVGLQKTLDLKSKEFSLQFADWEELWELHQVSAFRSNAAVELESFSGRRHDVSYEKEKIRMWEIIVTNITIARIVDKL